MRTLFGPHSGVVSRPPSSGHDWMRAPSLDNEYNSFHRRIAYRCQRCMSVHFLTEGVLPRPEDSVVVSGVSYGTCEEAAAALVLSS